MSEQPLPRPIFCMLARIGLAARAFVYLSITSLLVWSALMPTAQEDGASPGDVFRVIENEQGGRLILLAIAAGLFLYSGWRYMQAGFDLDDAGNDAKGVLARLGMVSSGTSYFLVGIAALTVTFGSNSGSGGGATETSAQFLIGQPFGRWLVALGGLALVGIGCAQVWRTISDQWKKHIDLSGWAERTTGLIEFGIAGRGVLFMLVGLFLIVAGWQADASEVKGLAATLGWVREQPFGLWLFLLAGLAIGAYGLYSGVQSVRYRFGQV